jgi:hypothetical protein
LFVAHGGNCKFPCTPTQHAEPGAGSPPT